MKSATRYSLFIALAGFVISLILFLPAYNAGRVHDFTGFFLNMRGGTFQEALGSFNYNLVQPLLQSFNLMLFTIAGRSGLAYFLIFHLLFAFGLYAWARFLYETTESKWLPALILLAITVNPYIVEVLVYKVCQAYLLSFILLGFYHLFALRFLKYGGNRKLAIIVALLLAQMWTFDFILIYPMLTILLLGLLANKTDKHKGLALLGISTLIVGLYFLENRILIGTWVGHYGSDVHFSFDFRRQLATCIKYYIKHLTLGQFWSYPIRHFVYGLALHWLAIVSFVFMSIFGLYRLYRTKKGDSKHKLSFYFLMASLVVLIPVSNLSFQDLLLTENDRYGFLCSVFLICAIITLFFSIRNTYLKWGLLSIFLVVNFFGQHKLIDTWAVSQRIVEKCLTSLPAEAFDSEESIFLLNLPDNYHGAYLFKNLDKESKLFEETYIVQFKDTAFAQINVVAQMNMVDVEDGARATEREKQTFLLELNQYGTWWWRNGNGAYSYESPNYKMKLDGLTYTLTYHKEGNKSFVYENSQWNRVSH